MLPSRRRLELLRRRHGIRSFALFGSSVRSDFRPDSDVDVMVAFEPEVSERFDRLTAIELEFEAASGRDVDVVAEDRLPHLVRQSIDDEIVAL
ncbi:MAG TPA: nucleotidyltransferase domain-containing protein [Candidatus Dormibacteraeota bacterium]|nr:nucleotidyltransferase domain-containing protein [Candidatus Dormibacteraeota bacterium]